MVESPRVWLARISHELLDGFSQDDFDTLVEKLAERDRAVAAAARGAAAAYLEAKATQMSGSLTGDFMGRIFKDQAAAIRSQGKAEGDPA